MAGRDEAHRSHRLIEENLKRVYQETLDEEIPDRFKTLLERLKTTQPPETSGDDSSEGEQ